VKKEAQGSYLAIIPARGGSVGLPRKNLRSVQGISLTARAVLIARCIKRIKWIMVSTDDKDIAREAERAGAEIPFLRPENLSRSETPMSAVLEHAMDCFESTIADPNRCHGVVLLQPTSPMRTVSHVLGAIHLYESLRSAGEDVAAVHTVSPVPSEFSPWEFWVPRKSDRMDGNDEQIGRTFQPVDGLGKREIYYRNGAAVILTPENLKALTLSGGPVFPYIINEPLVSIDSIYDLLRAEHCGRRLEPDPEVINWPWTANSAEINDQ